MKELFIAKNGFGDAAEIRCVQPIVIISSWGKGVSFTGVLRHIISSLGNRRIYLLALDQKGEVQFDGNLTVIPAWCEGYEPRKAQLIYEAVRRINPAAVFYYYDLFAAQFHLPALSAVQHNIAPVSIYLPIDGNLCNVQPLHAVTTFARVVFFTAADRRKFIALNSELQTPGELESLNSRCRVIPHGVNREHFFATAGGAESAKQKAFPNYPQTANAPIVMNGNRPWERKRLDLTIAGFARFLKESRREVFLYRHLPNARNEDVNKLVRQTDALGIRDRVIFREPGWKTIEELNLIYNACEVGIKTAMGEGWGLVRCEHGASGAAQIVPGSDQQHDIWNSSAVYAETSATEKIWACPHLEYQTVTADSVAESLGRIFSDDNFLNERSRAAQSKMHDPRFDWKVIEQLWVSLFTEITEKIPAA